LEVFISQQNQAIQQVSGRLGILAGGLILALPVSSGIASAVPTPSLNPCPRIYYEEPHNSTRQVPQGCPPNAATQRLIEQEPAAGQQSSVNAPSPTSGTSSQPPLPENSENAIATIAPAAGKVSVKLKNQTNAQVSYQAIDYTETRILASKQEVVLKDLPTPVTITMVREDGGLVKVTPMPSSKSGMLTVSLDETTTLSDSKSTLRVRNDGEVFAN
jgi:hypothetical protein